jgi:CheY-like chemotaxis protein
MELSPQRIANGASASAVALRRVLVIDDDDCIGSAIQAILAGRGCETVHESRACAGIQRLEQSVFDVVMIDIFLKGLSGLDAIEYIRRGSSIPIVAMSGFRLRSSVDAVDYLAMAVLRGATYCMRKPFKSVQLIEAVERNSSARSNWPC